MDSGSSPKSGGVGDKLRNEWRERVHDKRCVAVGEVGLDGNGAGRQREWVVMGALLALDTGKPIVIHCRGGLNITGNAWVYW